jgi:hypothetical protein
MKIQAHIEKFRRFDRLRSRFDPQADFELWYWMTLNAGTAIINAALHAAGVTREDDSFTTQIANIYSIPGPQGVRSRAYRFGVDIIHVGMPKINQPLPPALVTAFAEMNIIEEFRDPCVRENRPVSASIISTCSDAYARCVSAATSLVNL